MTQADGAHKQQELAVLLADALKNRAYFTGLALNDARGVRDADGDGDTVSAVNYAIKQTDHVLFAQWWARQVVRIRAEIARLDLRTRALGLMTRYPRATFADLMDALDCSYDELRAAFPEPRAYNPQVDRYTDWSAVLGDAYHE